MNTQQRSKRRDRASTLSPEQQQKLAARVAGTTQLQQPLLAQRDDLWAETSLTAAQQRLFTAWQLDPTDNAYNLAGVLIFQGQLLPEYVQQAFAYLLQKHPVLNCNFVQKADGTVVQAVATTWRFEFSQQQDVVDPQALLHPIAMRPFNLCGDPLLRVALFASHQQTRLLVVMHHIVTDGTSMQQLLHEFVMLYQQLLAGKPLAAGAPTADYLDYANWLSQQQPSQQALLAQQQQQWLAALGDDFAPLRLPSNPLARRAGNYTIASASVTLDSQLWQQLQHCAAHLKATPFVLLLAAFQYLLSRYANQTDIKVGVPIANRHLAQTEGLVGFFVNTQVMRAVVAADDSFASLVERVQQFSLLAQSNQDLPFEQLLDAIRPERLKGYHPLFQVLFNYLKRDKRAVSKLGAAELLGSEALRFSMPFDLQLDVIEEQAGPSTLHLYFAAELYETSIIEQLLQSYVALLSATTNQPCTELSALAWYPAAYQQALLQFGQGEKALPIADTIPALLHHQAQLMGEHPAVIFGNEQLSYREFDARTNQLAHWLQAQGVGAEDQVGLFLERSFAMVLSIVAIVKAGAAYVPVDPFLPVERVQYIANNSAMKLLLADRAADFDTAVYQFNSLDLASYPTSLPPSRIAPAQAAYVIYTSGSTGNPKGVVNSHEALYNRIFWQQNLCPIDWQHRVLQKTPYGFDVSVWEFFWPLLTGATLVVAPPELHKDPHALASLIQQQQITTLHFVPSMLQAFVDEPSSALCRSMRQMLCSGEAMSAPLQAQALARWPSCAIYNLYGPTEAAIDVSVYRCDGDISRTVPIGRPINGIGLYVLDSHLELCPLGSVGELYIGGIGLARGYVNRSALTAERFIASPLHDDGQRLYRTGDLVRWNASGALEYLGRTDHQVKIRGLRIELGEIEHALRCAPAVKEAVVVAQQEQQSWRLVAYVAVESSGESSLESSAAPTPDSAALRRWLASKLPEYMVPAHIELLTALPLSANGKVDRKALPAVSFAAQSSYVAAEGEVEQAFATIWAQVLGLAQVGRFDNFFALGGDSIIALQIIGKIRQQGWTLTPAALFAAGDIATLAQNVPPRVMVPKREPLTGEVALLPMQQRFFATQASPSAHYNQAIVLTLPQRPDLALLTQALALLIARHDALRLAFSLNGGAVSPPNAVNHFGQISQQCLPAQLCQAQQYISVHQLDEQDWLQHCTQQQQSLSFSEQRLQSLSLVELDTGEMRLLWVMHHLLVDGVSWRILVDDLTEFYHRLQQNLPLELPHFGHHLADYSNALAHYSVQHAAELDYWQTLLQAVTPMPVIDAQAGGTFAASHSASFCSQQAQTQLFLKHAAADGQFSADGILLAVLAQALAQWQPEQQHAVWLEGHGRAFPESTGVDFSQTVGWLTARYPQPLATAQSSWQALLEQQHLLELTPNGGIGFLACYMSEHGRCLQQYQGPAIEFNYLGQFGQQSNQLQWTLADVPAGPFVAPETELPVPLLINGFVYRGELRLEFTANAKYFSMASLGALVQAFGEQFTHVMHALNDSARSLTLAQCPLLTLTEAEFAELSLDLKLVEKIYPLSPMQLGMYFHSLQQPAQAAYINQSCLQIDHLEVSALQQAWRQLIARHDVLRTGFINSPAGPLQYVQREVEPSWQLLDWRELALTPTQLMHKINDLATEVRSTAFRVEQQRLPAGLMHFTLIELPAQRHVFIWTVHHLITDGWSSSALFGELLQAYQGQLLAPPPAQFDSYLQYLANQDKAQALDFYQARLATLPSPSYVHMACSSIGETSGYGQQFWQLPAELLATCQRFAKTQQITLNTLFQGAWALVVGHLTGQQQLCFGVTTSGRPADMPAAAQIQGVFINTLPLVVSRTFSSTASWLRQLQADNLAARAYEYLPLAHIQTDAAGHIAQQHFGLFDSIMVFENYPMSAALQQLGSAQSNFALLQATEHTSYPLTLSVMLQADVLLELTYQQALVSADFAKQLMLLLRTSLQQLLERQQLADICLAPQESTRLQANQPAATPARPVHDSLWQQLCTQAQLRPQQRAVTDQHGYLTYLQLYQQATQLAMSLSQQGVVQQSRVALRLEKSADFVISQLALMALGAACVPLDLALPLQRQREIIRQAGVSFEIYQAGIEPILPQDSAWSFQRVVIQTSVIQTSASLPAGLESWQGPTTQGAIAYIIFTSGTTGTPKGIEVSYTALLQHLEAMQQLCGYQAGDTLLHFATLGFDAAQEQFWTPLLAGAGVVLADPRQTSGDDILALIVRHQISVLDVPPAVMRQLTQLPTSIRLALVGGEAWPQAEQHRLAASHPTLAMINAYGPTEAVITPGAWHSQRDVAGHGPYVSLGKPVGARHFYVLDAFLQPCARGVVGELFIGGPLLAQGYLAQPSLTAERFIADPFAGDGGRMYQTGDLVRWQDSGALEYIGRSDQQLKIRGLRIEPGEIEAKLLAYPGVSDAVVLTQLDAKQQPVLVAYLVAPTVEVATLQQWLRSQLPEYMVPAVLQAVALLPRNANGKVDKAALAPVELVSRRPYLAPTSFAEHELCRWLASILSINELSVSDNFFALGGNSVSSLQLLAMANREGWSLQLQDIFQASDLQTLATRLQRMNENQAGTSIHLPIPATEIPHGSGYRGLSFAQERQWFLWRLEPSSSAYHIVGALRLQGRLDKNALAAALRYVLEQHASLRSVFHEDEQGVVSQSWHSSAQFQLQQRDLSGADELDVVLSQVKAELLHSPFDLTTDLLFRATLLTLAETPDSGDYELLIVMHHIVVDGWSVALLVEDFVKAYQHILDNQPLAAVRAQISYQDYAHWQRQYLVEQGAKQLNYWRDVLLAEAEPLCLPVDLVNPTQQLTVLGETAQQVVQLNNELQQCIQRRASVAKCSEFTLLLAAWQLLLHRLTGQALIRVGMPIANRHQVQTHNLVGLLVNTQVISQTFSADMTLDTVLGNVQQALQGAQQHQDVPFEQVVDSLQLSRDSQASLFQVMINHQQLSAAEQVVLRQLNITPAALPARQAQFAWVLNSEQSSAGVLSLSLEYAAALFSASLMQWIANAYVDVLQALCSQPTLLVAQLPLLPAAVSQQLLAQGEAKEQSETKGQCDAEGASEAQWPAPLQLMPGLPSRMAARVDTVALRCAQQCLTYPEFAAAVAQLAGQLQHQLWCQPETVVGLLDLRNCDTIVALFALWQLGACVVPLDTALPIERLAQIASQSAMAYLVNPSAGSAPGSDDYRTLPCSLLELAPLAVQMDTATEAVMPLHIEPHIEPQQLAYLIFTSGSTGQPKAVAVSHQALAQHCAGMLQRYQYSSLDHSLLFASLGFDAGLEQLLVPLLAGACVSVVNGKTFSEDVLYAYHQRQALTVLDLPPGYLSQCAALPSVRLCIAGGEAWAAADFARVQAQLPHAQLVNAYGPTEAVISPTLWQGDGSSQLTSPYVPIGFASDGRRLYVLDESLNLLAPGVAGELFIGGPVLARGYLGQPAQSAARFIADPFSGDGGRMYRTGDRVRWGAQGLEYLGRIDQQFKLRGYRIEPGEIEACLRRQPDAAGSATRVQDAVVLVAELDGRSQLVAYVSPADCQGEMLRQQLATQLPAYMVPAVIVSLAQLPRNRNGKIDRQALPAVSVVSKELYQAPVGALECQLAEIWQAVLGVRQVGRQDNFFRLGGDSMACLKVVAMAKRQGIELSLAALYNTSDLQTLATAAQANTRQPALHRLADRYQGLSYAQERQWVLWQLEPHSSAYHIVGAMDFTGELNLTAHRAAFDYVWRQHEALRTTFEMDAQGILTQQVYTDLPYHYEWHDFALLPEALSQQALAECWQQLSERPFDLRQGPLLRVGLVRLAPDHYQQLVVLHHIVADGWSVPLIISDFNRAYQAAISGSLPESTATALRYSDYAAWQRQWLADGEGARQLTYWLDVLGDEHPILPFPLDLHADISSDRSATIQHRLTSEMTEQLRRYAKQQGVTLFSVLMSAWQVLLYRYTNQAEIRVGMPIANRQHSGTEQIVGFFVNTLVINHRFSGEQTLAEVVLAIQQRLAQAQAHQDLPLGQLLEHLSLERDASQSPLFQVMANHQVIEAVEALELPQVKATPVVTADAAAQFDLVFNSQEWPDGAISINLEYALAKFSESTVELMLSALFAVLKAILTDQCCAIAQLPLLPAAVSQQLLAQGEAKEQSETKGQCDAEGASEAQLPAPLQLMPGLPSRMAARVDTVALRCAQQCLTYPEFAAAVAQLAGQLQHQLWCQPETVVGLLDLRNCDTIVALFALWQLGACVVPLDTALPIERLAQIASQSAMAYLVNPSAGSAPGSDDYRTLPCSLLELAPLAVQMDTATEAVMPLHIEPHIEPQQLAYLIFTSGSTGQPKAVAVSHQALAQHCAGMLQRYQYSSLDHSLLFASLGFDAGLEQLLVPLLAGACVSVVNGKTFSEDVLYAYHQRQALTVLDLPPGYLSQCAALPSVRLCIAGGEAWAAADFARVQAQLPHAQLVNAYGPTEAVISPTLWQGDGSSQLTSPYVPIGFASDGRRLYVLDESLNLLAPGVAGELFIGGPVLARGYLGQPAQSAARFIADPFSGDGGRMYRTGDRVRWGAQGLEYLGRIDQQFKLRGYRIEPGEIEACLRRQPDAAGSATRVQDAVVLVAELDGRSQLVAYVSPADCQGEMLRQQLATQLPAYMVPAVIVSLAQLPRNRNGKIDRQALPAVSVVSKELYQAPVGALECQLAEIWQAVLGVRQVGRQDNFFRLGGDSIAALRLVSQLRQRLGYQVSVKTLFNFADFMAFADVLSSTPQAVPVAVLTGEDTYDGVTAQNDVARSEVSQNGSSGSRRSQRDPLQTRLLYPLAPAQQSLWLSVQQAVDDLDRAAYNIAGTAELTGELDVAILQQALQLVVARHQSLRTQFVYQDEQPMAVVLPQLDLTLQLVDVSQLPPALQQQAQRAAQQQAELHVFDLAQAPLLQATLIQLSAGRAQLVLVIHHIVADGWSMGVLLRDLSEAYISLLAQRDPDWPNLTVHYSDYARWQQQMLTGATGQRLREFWLAQLAGAPLQSALPTQYPRPAQLSMAGQSVQCQFTAPQSERLRQFAQTHQVSLHNLLLAGYQLWLHALTGQTDLITGLDLAGRDQAELEDLIGFFIRVAPLRSRLCHDDSILTFIQQIQQQSLVIAEHQAMGLESLIDLLDVERRPALQPLVQQLFVMQQPTKPLTTLGALQLTPLDEQSEASSKFDHALFVIPDNQLQCSLVFRTQLYATDQMDKWLQLWQRMVLQLIEMPNQTVGALILHSKQEFMVMQKTTQASQFSGLKKGLIKRAVSTERVFNTAKLAGDQDFPLVIEPAVPNLDPVLFASQHRDEIEKLLQQHAGLLFRNFDLHSAIDFERFAEALQPGLYGQYGDLPKNDEGKRTYKSTPYPEQQMILFHNESSHLQQWPRKQWFFCELPSKVGGATPIVDCRRMLQVLSTDLVQKLRAHGLLYVRNFLPNIDVSWQDFYKTTEQAVVEAKLRASETAFCWLPNGGLQTRTRTKAIIVHPLTGEESFFNQIQLHHELCLEAEVQHDLIELVGLDLFPRRVFFGDGSPISADQINEISAAYESCAVRFAWQRGDVVMLDNMLAAHARDPYEEPRKIVVAMGDMYNHERLEASQPQLALQETAV